MTAPVPLLQRIALVLFPASLLIVAVVGIGWTFFYRLSPWLTVVFVVLMALCVPLSLRLRGEVRRTCEMESVRERVRALEEQERMSAAYQEKLLADEEGIRVARHRVAEEVAEARAMIAARDGGGASRRLSRALELMGDGAYRQCDHPSADAMASMKAQACRDAGIDPQFALEISRDVPVSAVDLCAVLGNLVDNALAAAVRAREGRSAVEGAGAGSESGSVATAAAESRSGDEPAPYVRLTAEQRDGYLVITAQNPVGPVDAAAFGKSSGLRRRRPRSVASHGWGLSIVSSVAARYGGALVTDVRGGVFRATAVLGLESTVGEREGVR